MADLQLSDITSKMRKLDICMMTTQAHDGRLTSRPMSNNGDVEYDGNSYFYCYEDSEVIRELKFNTNVNLAFEGPDKLYIAITGKSDLIKDKEVIKQHWVESLDEWFKEGTETPGIIMIHVKAESIKFWHREENGEVKI